MAETAEALKTDLEYRRSVNSVWLLRDMHQSPELELKQRLFEQACDQEASHISEVLVGAGHTQFEFGTLNEKLYILQPGGVTDWMEMHQNGAERARRMADANRGLEFYARIAEAELEEARLQEEMVKSGEPQTMISLSLSGEDLASDDTLRAVGRDPQLRRAYLRTSVFDGQKLHLDSRTIDHLGADEAKALYKDILGIELAPDADSLDILNYPAKFPGIRKDLTDRIAPPPLENTYDFVLRHQDLLQAHMGAMSELALDCQRDDLADIADNLRYDIMSSYKQRLEGQWVDKGSLAESVVYAGSVERGAGTQYIGCDAVIGAQKPGLETTGYVNAGREFWVWRDGKCRIPNCPSHGREKINRPKVGPCDICELCQPLFDSGMGMVDIESVYKRRPKTKKTKAKAPGLFEAVAAELARYAQEQNAKKPKS